MKKTILYFVGAFSFYAIVQLLFFWTVPTAGINFWAIYPFLSLLTPVHVVLLYRICKKYNYPACFPFAFISSAVVVLQITASFILGLLRAGVRPALFTECVIIGVYVLTSALFVGMA